MRQFGRKNPASTRYNSHIEMTQSTKMSELVSTSIYATTFIQVFVYRKRAVTNDYEMRNRLLTQTENDEGQ